MADPVIEVGGRRYMSSSAVAKLWGLKTGTVSDYCKNGKIVGAFKVKERFWYLPIECFKPLSMNEIQRILILTLQLKNNPELKIDWSTFDFKQTEIKRVYVWLSEMGYIEKFSIKEDKRIPYEIALTQKGFDVATMYPKKVTSGFKTALGEWTVIIMKFVKMADLLAEMVEKITC